MCHPESKINCDCGGLHRSLRHHEFLLKSLRRWLHGDLVDVAEHPILASLERADERMLSGVKMFGGMPVPRGVTTANMAANQALTEVNPGVPLL
jgi:hypothetical protein